MVKRNRIVIFVALTNRRLILCQMGQRAMARHSGSAESLTLMSKCRSLPAFGLLLPVADGLSTTPLLPPRPRSARASRGW